jgi:hypothetical protein
MLNELTLLGAGGAGVLYAAKPFPALNAQVRHVAGLLAALVAGVALWAAGVKFASALPAGAALLRAQLGVEFVAHARRRTD